VLALDPGQVAACTLQLASLCDSVVSQAITAAPDLPCASDPLLDLFAERHAARADTLLAS